MQWQENPRRLEISGEWTLNNSESLLQNIRRCVSGEPAGRILLDLSALRFIDSRGISNLLELRKTLAENRHDLVIWQPSAVSRNVFQLISLDRLIPIESGKAEG